LADRPRKALVFGGGLDRSTGQMLVDGESFRKIVNAYLYSGKAEIRRGLGETLTLTAGEVIIHEAPIRSQGIGCVFTWDPATLKVALYRVSGDGSSSFSVGTVWTLTAGAARPLISADDSYSKLYIAHDEAVYAERMQTRVYDPATDTLTDLQADLYTSSVGMVDVFFRGVKRHLNYLIGWGYGTENDADRPEIVRVSLPGEPDTFMPQHYAICGQRNEAILGGWTAGDVFIARKDAASYVIIGDSRANFGVVEADDLHGVVSSRLGVTVGADNYFWSLSGPRMSRGGAPSVDLAELLDLAGPLPDALAAVTDQAYGFAVFDPVEREVLFVFGQWVYVLHLRDASELRWSYRRYAVSLSGGGIIFSGVAGPSAGSGGGGGGGGAGSSTAFPTITTIVAIGNSGATVSWTNDGTLVGGEIAEVWARPAGGSWSLFKDSIAVAGAGESEAVTGMLPATVYDVAVRFKLVGVYGPGYTSSDPANWPAVSRGTVTMGAALASPTINILGSACTPGQVIAWFLTNNSGNKTRVQSSTDGGSTWVAVTVTTHPTNSGEVAAEDSPVYYFFRFRHENTAGDTVSQWVTAEVGSHPGCP